MKTILIFPWAKKLRNGEKRNPKDYYAWPELVKLIKDRGYHTIQVSLSGEDEIGADELVLDKSFEEISEMINNCWYVLTIDSMAAHLAWYLKKEAVVLFSQSDPLIFGHSENMNILKDRKYLRPDPFNIYEGLEYKQEAFHTPEEIIDKLKKAELV